MISARGAKRSDFREKRISSNQREEEAVQADEVWEEVWCSKGRTGEVEMGGDAARGEDGEEAVAAMAWRRRSGGGATRREKKGGEGEDRTTRGWGLGDAEAEVDGARAGVARYARAEAERADAL
jgi:hypothetical protein